ncbi:chemotaxis protein CheW [Sodalinema gerasimenkoae]|uniref:chemotaxis protein CheW n=1 Tax=Sodalinema gerasimenkoae TaxID=2862348 RepID=UPI00135702A8|nr:chemotaxis protein CheW [Sodalinema gerasimenkoae]
MPSETHPGPHVSPPSQRTVKAQFVIFCQHQSRFAIALTSVREVLRLSDQRVTPVPNSPNFVLGLTNLRGEILAVADFGKFLGLTPVDRSHSEGRILVVEAANVQDPNRSLTALGLAVSHVETVVALDPNEMRSAAEASAELVPFLQGLYNHQGHLISVIDIEAIATCRRW